MKPAIKLVIALTAAAVSSFPVAGTAQNYVTFEGDGAEKLFRQSRNAVGGEAAVMNVTSMVIKGASRVAAGDDGPPERVIEIRVSWPDQYLRIERAGDWTKTTGFNGKKLLTEIRTGSQVDKPPSNMTGALLRGERQRFARLLLGLGSFATPEVWMTIRQPMGTVELGSAFESGRTTNVTSGRVLEATAKENFMTTMFYDVAGLPLRVEYEANRRKVSIAFSDRRKVGNLLLPHTITTTLDGQPLEEIRVTEITLNPTLTKADFEK